MEEQHKAQEKFAYDTVAGPIYAFRPLDIAEARQLVSDREQPQIVSFLVHPCPEDVDRPRVLRRYYALNVPQAVARATEIEIRLREQGRDAVLLGVRCATPGETESFFRAMDALDARMPDPISGAKDSVTETPGTPRIITQRQTNQSKAAGTSQ